MNTAALSETTSTHDNLIYAEEAIGDMLLFPSRCGVDNKLTEDGHNKVDTRSRRRSGLLLLSAQCRRIINPGQFLMGGPP